MYPIVNDKGQDHVGKTKQASLLHKPVLERRRAHLRPYAIDGHRQY